jgi:hypothetical protein
MQRVVLAALAALVLYSGHADARSRHHRIDARPRAWCGWWLANHLGIGGALNRWLCRGRSVADEGRHPYRIEPAVIGFDPPGAGIGPHATGATYRIEPAAIGFDP